MKISMENLYVEIGALRVNNDTYLFVSSLLSVLCVNIAV